MINLSVNLSSYIDELDKKLNALAERFFDNPFTGMLVFIVLLVISCIAVRAYSKK